MIPAALTPAEVDLITEVAGLAEGQPVLDLMCGYGRHALELARRGYPVTAIDSAEGYITELTAAAAAEGLPVEAIAGDVCAGGWHTAFHAAICMGNSFSFLDKAALQQLLLSVHQSLKPGGTLVINTWMIAEIVFRHFKEREWYQVDHFKYLIESRYLTGPSRVEATHTVVLPEGVVASLEGVDYIYSIAELETLLSDCGFVLEQVYYTPRKRPFQLGDNKAYLIATSR